MSSQLAAKPSAKQNVRVLCFHCSTLGFSHRLRWHPWHNEIYSRGHRTAAVAFARWCKRSSAPQKPNNNNNNIINCCRIHSRLHYVFDFISQFMCGVVHGHYANANRLKVRTTDTHRNGRSLISISIDTPCLGLAFVCVVASCDVRMCVWLVGRGPSKSRSETTLKKRTHTHVK